MGKKQIAAIAAALAVVAGIATWLLLPDPPASPALELPSDYPVTMFELPMEDYENRVLDTGITLPPGNLVITKLRAEYQDGSMRLIIPRLELDVTIGGDTTQQTLAKGPGLYKYGQIPNLYNTNVSIAGHRDLPPYPFYYLDTLQEGDQLYLVYQDKLFRYEYRSTDVVEPTNWDPIRVYYDSRITLTTCAPLGTSRQRMIVTGELVSIEDYDPAADPAGESPDSQMT